MKLNTLIKALFIAVLTSLSACNAQPANDGAVVDHEAHSRMGSHGMAVLGTQHLLLNHMALYRTPHDRQILTPATILNEADRIAFENWRAGFDGIVSIVPESFDLNRLAPDAKGRITKFTADIYEGHFERGGTLKFKAIEFELESPAMHRPVVDTVQLDEWLTYIALDDAAYLVREINERPGTDEILGVATIAGLKSGSRFTSSGEEIRDGSITAHRNDGSKIEFTDVSTKYMETADFQ